MEGTKLFNGLVPFGGTMKRVMLSMLCVGIILVLVGCDSTSSKTSMEMESTTVTETTVATVTTEESGAGSDQPDAHVYDLVDAINTEVTFGDEAFPIRGTLSIPAVKGDRYPLVILVHGSGASDRDETILQNKPFRDLAQELVRQGIAVLRYDKRTFTYGVNFVPEERKKGFTVYDESIDDAVYAYQFAAMQSAINPDRIYIAGHSMGGNIAPRIVKETKAAGMISLAGNVSFFPDLMVRQYEYIANLDHVMDEKETAAIDQLKAVVEKIKTFDQSIEDVLLGAPISYWIDFKDYHAPSLAKTLNAEILILQGGKDYNVDSSEFEQWKETLGDRAVYKFYPNLHHLFMPLEGDPSPAMYSEEGHVLPKVAEDIADWIKGKNIN